MKVSDLQKLLADLGQLLDTSGAKGVGDLATFRESLSSFGDMTLKAFAGFLVKKEAAPAGSTQAKPRASTAGKSKTPGPDLELLKRRTEDLYEHAASATTEQVEALVAELEKLTKPGIKSVAEAIGLKVPSSKNKAEIGDEIRRRILARKGTTQRAGMIDRNEAAPTPESADDETPRPSATHSVPQTPDL